MTGGVDTSNNCTVQLTPCRTITHAISQSSSGDTINVLVGTYNQPTETFPLSITFALTISGYGPGTKTVDATGATRSVFAVVRNTSGIVALSGMTITGGVGAGSYDPGGGVSDYSADTLSLSDVIIRGNSGGIQDGGGIAVEGGTANLTNVTITGNSAASGGGIGNCGGETVNLTNVTISGNSAPGGGGIYNRGAAVLTNVTLSGNSATVAGSGGGIVNESGGHSTVSLQGTIIAGSGAGLDCIGDPITDQGYNADDDGTCGLGSTGDQPGVTQPLAPSSAHWPITAVPPRQ